MHDDPMSRRGLPTSEVTDSADAISRRELATMVATGVVAAPMAMSAARLEAAPPPDAAPPLDAASPKRSRGLVDPELLPWLESPAAGAPRHWPTAAESNASGHPVRIAERTIPGPAGAPAIRILILTPPGLDRDAPGLFYVHGGGYVGGTPENALLGCRGYAETSRCVVVITSYRLAPAARFPASLDDIYAALEWMHANARDLGVDPRRIAVGGASAGGGHAAALTIRARDRGELPVAFQLLSMPMLDDRTGSTRDPGPLFGEYLWTRAKNRAGWGALLGVAAGSDAVPPQAVPGRIADLSGLPPTFIGVGQLDLFVKENLDYAARLMDAGVATEICVMPGAFHGFDTLVADTAISRRFVAAQQAALSAAFARLQ